MTRRHLHAMRISMILLAATAATGLAQPAGSADPARRAAYKKVLELHKAALEGDLAQIRTLIADGV
ncbi:MAG: hypothetical protein ACOCZE_12340, partial [Planctomycetota bacterium]